MKLEIVDVNNVLRRRYEKDTTGLVLRNMYTAAAHNPNPVLFVFDGAGGKNRRREFYPDYKGNRPATTDEFRTQLGLFKLLVQQTNKIMIEVPGWEADDVIAYLVKLRKPTDPVFVIDSNDQDFLALLEEGKVEIADPSKKFDDIDYHDIRLHKALCGDTSDNIPGIKNFAHKSFLKLTQEQRDLWRHLLAEDSDETVLLTMDVRAELGLTEGCANWVKANFPLLKTFWKIVGFFDMDEALIQKHTIVGSPSYAAANAILGTVFQ